VSELAPNAVAETMLAPVGVVRSLVETTKPGITRLVTITAAVGFVLGAAGRAWTLGELIVGALSCLAGTAMSAAGANALNQWIERARDAAMSRTSRRPLPQGRVSPLAVMWTGLTLSTLGVGVLAAFSGTVPALLSLACVLVYVLVYTPMKVRTPLATFVGTIPGALPPLIGWTAASAARGVDSLLEPGGLSLFVLMTVWQVPHFLAIAWMYRDDYAKGGFCVLPTVVNGEARTVATVGLWSLLLLPATMAPGVLVPALGMPYLAVAFVSGVAFQWLAWKLITHRTRDAARAVFFGSIAHLPLLLLSMVGIAVWGVVWSGK